MLSAIFNSVSLEGLRYLNFLFNIERRFSIKICGYNKKNG